MAILESPINIDNIDEPHTISASATPAIPKIVKYEVVSLSPVLLYFSPMKPCSVLSVPINSLSFGITNEKTRIPTPQKKELAKASEIEPVAAQTIKG